METTIIAIIYIAGIINTIYFNLQEFEATKPVSWCFVLFWPILSILILFSFIPFDNLKSHVKNIRFAYWGYRKIKPETVGRVNDKWVDNHCMALPFVKRRIKKLIKQSKI